MFDISVIGGAGHVGLPLGILLATAGNFVNLIDKDQKKLEKIAAGKMPFNEPGGESLLNEALQTNQIAVSTDLSKVADSDVIIVVVGTPIDEHQNPQIDHLLDLVEDIVPHLTEDQLLVLRSTVYPGTTGLVRDTLERDGFEIGEDFFISFAPERIAQHKAFEESVQLPQLIGTFDDESYRQTETVFKTFLEGDCLRLRPTEAELGKLFTNMWRYLTFAAANEFYLIADTFASHHDLNINRIIDKTSHNYPRFDVPSPGSNVGGPCLTKDGWFLVDNIPYNELVSASYQINEGMVTQIIDRMAQMRPDPEKVTILGMTFKANSDDIRNSVSFKLRKQLQLKGYSSVVEIEPNLDSYDSWDSMADSDWIILMTPHDEFKNFAEIRETVNNEDALYCDIWGFWEEMRHSSDNGYFFGREVSDN
jgi:UDP-N-acetyl-D-mannosaminuronic acid dehydrogenase